MKCFKLAVLSTTLGLEHTSCMTCQHCSAVSGLPTPVLCSNRRTPRFGYYFSEALSGTAANIKAYSPTSSLNTNTTTKKTSAMHDAAILFNKLSVENGGFSAHPLF
jgi:hypothetical protein